MSRKHLFVFTALFTFLGLILAWLYLFRAQTIDNPTLGVMTVNYRWGRVHEILADSNRDGTIDYRELTRAPFGPISTHTSIALEYWEDPDFDGHFEHHVILESGSIKAIEIDEDADGDYELVLRGEEARTFYGSQPARDRGDN